MDLEYINRRWKSFLAWKTLKWQQDANYIKGRLIIYAFWRKNTASEPNLPAIMRPPCCIFRTLAYKIPTFILISSRFMITYYLVYKIEKNKTEALSNFRGNEIPFNSTFLSFFVTMSDCESSEHSVSSENNSITVKGKFVPKIIQF